MRLTLEAEEGGEDSGGQKRGIFVCKGNLQMPTKKFTSQDRTGCCQVCEE